MKRKAINDLSDALKMYVNDQLGRFREELLGDDMVERVAKLALKMEGDIMLERIHDMAEPPPVPEFAELGGCRHQARRVTQGDTAACLALLTSGTRFEIASDLDEFLKIVVRRLAEALTPETAPDFSDAYEVLRLQALALQGEDQAERSGTCPS